VTLWRAGQGSFPSLTRGGESILFINDFLNEAFWLATAIAVRARVTTKLQTLRFALSDR
jgi:hypothetical protein